MGEELGFNVLFYRLGYAWVLYEADEVERMRAIVGMHHRIGVRSRFLSPDETLRHLPVLRGGDPVAGAVLNDDAIVHHDAVVWAHLEHLARTGIRAIPNTAVHAMEGNEHGVEVVQTDRGQSARGPSSTPPAGGPRPQRAGRRLGAQWGASARGPRHRSCPPVDRGCHHVLPADRGMVQPDPSRRDRHGHRRSR